MSLKRVAAVSAHRLSPLVAVDKPVPQVAVAVSARFGVVMAPIAPKRIANILSNALSKIEKQRSDEWQLYS